MSPLVRIALFCGLGSAVVLSLMMAGASRVPLKADAPKPALLQAISACRRLVADSPRLICYDKTVAALDDAMSQGLLNAFDREQATAVRRESFGFHLPTLSLFTSGPKEDEVNSVTLTLSGARQNAREQWMLTVADGPVWVQTDTRPLFGEPHAGSHLEVSKGALGSYFCTIDRRDTFRCARQQ